MGSCVFGHIFVVFYVQAVAFLGSIQVPFSHHLSWALFPLYVSHIFFVFSKSGKFSRMIEFGRFLYTRSLSYIRDIVFPVVRCRHTNLCDVEPSVWLNKL